MHSLIKSKRVLSFLSLIAINLCSFLTPANAHMGISSSNPSNGSQISYSPEVLNIKFTTNVDLDSAAARLRFIGVDAKLTEINNKDVPTQDLSKITGVGEGDSATFDLPELENGLYAIDWAVNEIGGHSNTSTIIFKVLNESSDKNIIILLVLITTIILLIYGGYLLSRRKNV
jgi:methionine-rich copper-binding protein CopC